MTVTSQDLLERVVRAAVRGVVEAVLYFEPQLPPPIPDPERPVFSEPPERVVDEVPFPSVSKAQEELFGEPLPEGRADLDMTLEALARAQKQQAQDAQPAVQPGPGEREVAEWLRIPQS